MNDIKTLTIFIIVATIIGNINTPNIGQIIAIIIINEEMLIIEYLSNDTLMSYNMELSNILLLISILIIIPAKIARHNIHKSVIKIYVIILFFY
jgi:hypothetical protein